MSAVDALRCFSPSTVLGSYWSYGLLPGLQSTINALSVQTGSVPPSHPVCGTHAVLEGSAMHMYAPQYRQNELHSPAVAPTQSGSTPGAGPRGPSTPPTGPPPWRPHPEVHGAISYVDTIRSVSRDPPPSVLIIAPPPPAARVVSLFGRSGGLCSGRRVVWLEPGALQWYVSGAVWRPRYGFKCVGGTRDWLVYTPW